MVGAELHLFIQLQRIGMLTKYPNRGFQEDTRMKGLYN